MENPSFEMSEPSKDSANGDITGNNNGLTYRGSRVAPESESPSERRVSVDLDSNSLPNNERNKDGVGNPISRVIVGIRSGISSAISKNKKLVKGLCTFVLFAAYNAYLLTAVIYAVRHEIPIAWCDGLGFLLVCTGIVYWSLFYYVVLKGYCGKWIHQNVGKPLGSLWSSIFSKKWVGMVLGLVILGGVIAFIIIDCWGDPRRLVSASGVLVIVLVCLLLSKHPGQVRWRQVMTGLALQFVFGLAVLRWEGGRSFLECLSKKVTIFLAYADDGSSFIYNFAASGKLQILGSAVPELVNTELIIPTTFAFTSLSVIFFFGFFVSLLYHIGAMLWVVRKVGWVLKVIIGTSAAESINAAANIFLGQTEAPLIIKPFMNDLTKSELHAVMTGGFATIAGTVMAAYIRFGVKADSLLAASVMAAPCALGLSKLMYPEVEESKTTIAKIKDTETKAEGNALDAAAQGAIQGVILIGNIIANILAFVSFIAFLNGVLGWLGALVGLEELSFEWLLGKVFIPVALVIGVPPDEAEDVALLLGLKTTVNEFVAYSRLQTMNLSERSVRLSEFALCGFANFSSMGIQIGALGVMAPDRRPELSVLVWRALFTGIAASLLNACIAGTLLTLSDETPGAVDNTIITSTISSLIL